ncbi:cysteine desulfurase family protein [Arcticibacterium luteifluviistationis]|uniref:IscS subfamily cysteine desulfurase n=1 Tax=Arcticibacterium luteifluviistationis TaxID=1784714 RepID=A0A2Z4GE60_9BACT|nr:cysteine desulfurase family protein [Arcticibacterium luteifluviistationis]AWV99536.1 IscS subfamily cysteine desulfurase [Arcticibacterium luteifluviistationis]
MNYPIYLDYAATTPVDKKVLEAMLPYFTEHFGNAASRFHAYGWEAEEAVDLAKAKIAKKLNWRSDEIVFTSGATESINLALKGVFENFKGHLITFETEHKATLDTAEYLESRGVKVSKIGVAENGEIDLNELEKAIQPDTKLISIMHVNNETGVIMPVSKVIALAHKKSVLVHIDASQSLGKLDIPKEADLISFSAHKIYGPKGVGVLLAKKEVKLSAQIHGGRHQRNRRSGTLNIPGIVGIGEAVTKCKIEENGRLGILKSAFEERIIKELPFVKVNASSAPRVGAISSLCFQGLDGEDLLIKLSKIAVSNGSACNSASTEPSYVLKAMGLSEQDAFSSIRFSLGRFTTKEDMENATNHVIEIVKNYANR